MDLRLQKFRLALGIIGAGMALSLLYHGWQGWVQGKGYPYNTFLCFPQGRYDDFTNYLRYTLSADPYKGPLGVCNNFPASYLLLYPFAAFAPVTGAVIFIDLCVVALYCLLQHVLKTAIPQAGWRAVASVLFLWSYPVIYCQDRGNNDILLFFWVALSLYCYSQKKFSLSLLCLLPPICVKFYPGLLLILFFRRKLFHWAIAGVLAFCLVSWLALLSFQSPVSQSYHAFQAQLADYNLQYNLEWAGVAASASAWNPFRIVVWMIYVHRHHTPEYVSILPLSVAQSAMEAYGAICLVGLVVLLLDIFLVETSFARRAILLLLFMTVSSPGGGDYKLMYVGLALVTLCLVRQPRSYDRAVVALLAFCLFPKRELMLNCMGPSDTHYADASIAVILNPTCMLMAMLLLLWSGWQAAVPLDFGQRLRKFLGIFSFAGLRFRRLPPRLI